MAEYRHSPSHKASVQRHNRKMAAVVVVAEHLRNYPKGAEPEYNRSQEAVAETPDQYLS